MLKQNALYVSADSDICTYNAQEYVLVTTAEDQA